MERCSFLLLLHQINSNEFGFCIFWMRSRQAMGLPIVDFSIRWLNAYDEYLNGMMERNRVCWPSKKLKKKEKHKKLFFEIIKSCFFFTLTLNTSNDDYEIPTSKFMFCDSFGFIDRHANSFSKETNWLLLSFRYTNFSSSFCFVHKIILLEQCQKIESFVLAHQRETRKKKICLENILIYYF